MRLLTQILSAALLMSACAFASAATDDRDLIERADGKNVRAYILRETIGELIYSSKKEGGSEQTIRWKDVDDFEYNAMLGSVWTGPQQAIFDGDYTTAIKQLAGLAGVEKSADTWQVKSGEDFDWNQIVMWKRAYGLFYLGHALELSGERAEAAQAFGVLVEKLPEHRLSLYGIFRQGVNLALSGGDPKASEEAIKKFTTTDAAALAGDLERALGVIALAGAGDFKKAERESSRLRTRFRENLTDWLYWRELWASVLIEQKEFDKAENIYSEIYDKMAGNPKRRARAALLLGRLLEAAGKLDDAMVYFLQLDVLPLVGKADLAEARFKAASIFMKRLESLESDEKTRVSDLAKGLFSAVVKYAPDDSDLVLEAQTIIDEQLTPAAEGAEEGAEAEAAEEGEEETEAAD